MKNNKGVTLVALIVTILVMGVILGISITGASEVLTKSKATEYIGYMKLVKARADVVFEDELFNTSNTSISTGSSMYSNEVKAIDGSEERRKYFI